MDMNITFMFVMIVSVNENQMVTEHKNRKLLVIWTTRSYLAQTREITLYTCEENDAFIGNEYIFLKFHVNFWYKCVKYQFDDQFNLINFLIGNTNNTGEFRIFFLIGNSYQLRFRVFFGSEGGSVLFFLIWKLCTLLDILKFITNPQFCTLNSFFFLISANTNSSTISCFNLTLVLQAQKFCIFKSPFYSNRQVLFFFNMDTFLHAIWNIMLFNRFTKWISVSLCWPLI